MQSYSLPICHRKSVAKQRPLTLATGIVVLASFMQDFKTYQCV